ncbi:hypothetical protein GW17_00046450 [Ensete ventricosum]|nr:hypothetical protein GW17_00046450 [Ensete ventricosum]
MEEGGRRGEAESSSASAGVVVVQKSSDAVGEETEVELGGRDVEDEEVDADEDEEVGADGFVPSPWSRFDRRVRVSSIHAFSFTANGHTHLKLTTEESIKISIVVASICRSKTKPQSAAHTPRPFFLLHLEFSSLACVHGCLADGRRVHSPPFLLPWKLGHLLHG